MMTGDDQSVPELDVREVHERSLNGEGIVLDVRESEELHQISLTGAVHIPLNDLPARLDDLPADRDIFVICHVGQRSAIATQYLRQCGRERVWNVRGGIVAWLRARLPANWSSTG